MSRCCLGEIHPAGDRHVAERADIAFDEVQAEQAHRTDERTGIKAGLEMAEQLHELVEHADARPAGIDEARDALIDADRIGIGKAERAVGVNVDVDPAGADILPGYVDRSWRPAATSREPTCSILPSAT